MPRKAPDEVQEQRITLGNLEREALRSILNVQRAQVVSSALVGAAGAVSAGGVLLAAAAFAAWKAPGVVSDAAGAASQAVQNALGVVVARNEQGRLTVEPGVGGLAGVGGLLDLTGDKASGGVITLRREAQALARERGEIAQSITTFCSTNGSKYDQAKCNAAHDRKDAYFRRLNAFRARVDQYVQNQVATGGLFRAQDIYGGGTSGLGSLGDIDPNYRP